MIPTTQLNIIMSVSQCLCSTYSVHLRFIIIMPTGNLILASYGILCNEVGLMQGVAITLWLMFPSHETIVISFKHGIPL